MSKSSIKFNKFLLVAWSIFFVVSLITTIYIAITDEFKFYLLTITLVSFVVALDKYELLTRPVVEKQEYILIDRNAFSIDTMLLEDFVEKLNTQYDAAYADRMMSVNGYIMSDIKPYVLKVKEED